MASFTERLQILIDADAKGAAAEIQGLGRTAERSLGSTENKVQQLSGQMVAFGSATLVAGGVAAAGLFKVAQAASNLSEAQNAANVTLGADGARALEEYADTAAQTAGVSKRAALEYGASFALFVNKAGFVGEAAGDVSADLVQLAGDISSLRNVPIEESLTAIQSALAGETEAIRRFGIDISDATLKQEIFARTGEKVSGTLTQQQKVQEIINQLYAQGAVFADDFVNTSDSLANRQRALAAEFENTSAAVGEALLPAFEAVLGTAQGAFSAFNGLDEGTKNAVGGIAGVATAATLTVGAVSLLAGGALKAADNLTRLGAAGRLLTSTLKGGIPLAVAFGLTEVASGVVNDITGNTERLNSAMERLGQNLQENSPALRDFFAAANTENLSANPFTLAWQLIEDSIRGSAEAADGTTPSFRNLERVINDTAANGSAALQALEDQLRQERERLDRNSQAWRDYGTILDIIDAKQRQMQPPDLGRGAGAGIAAAQAEAEGAGDAAETAAGQTDEYGQSMDAAKEAADALKGALAKLTATQKLNSLAFDIGRARADAFTEALERSTNADNLLKSGISVGRALNDFKGTLGLIPEEAEDAADETDAVAEAMEALRRAVSDADPALSQIGITMGSAKAAASAFGQSLKQAAGLSDRAASALDVGDSFREVSRSIRRLPADLDLVAISMGDLRPRARDAVSDILNLGDSIRSYLETLLSSGATYAEVTGEAGRFRSELERQLAQAGLNEEQVARYIRTLGLAPDQVSTSIRLAGLEASRFKLNAYIQLLDGKIPPEVATQVIAQINNEDLDGAAATLAAFAQTNPPVIDVAPKGQDKLEETKGTLQDLPRTYDALTAATGGYTDKQLDALDAVLGLGDAYRGFLGELYSADPAAAIDLAGKLREQFAATVEGLNLTEEELHSYYGLLGIAPEQITTAIEIANFDATVFEITTVISLLQGIGELDPEVALRISDALLREDYAEVRRLLESEVDAALGLNTDPALLEDFPIFQRYIQGTQTDTNVGADTGPARSEAAKLFFDIERLAPIVRVGLSLAAGAGAALGNQVSAAVNAITSSAVIPGGFDEKIPNRNGGRDGDPRTPRALGGPVMPNRKYLVGEDGPELLEFGRAAAITPTDVTERMLSPSASAMVDFDPTMFAKALERVNVGGDGVTIERIDITETADARATGAELVRQLSAERFLRGAA